VPPSGASTRRPAGRYAQCIATCTQLRRPLLALLLTYRLPRFRLILERLAQVGTHPRRMHRLTLKLPFARGRNGSGAAVSPDIRANAEQQATAGQQETFTLMKRLL
jgi:hypothetical protein